MCNLPDPEKIAVELSFSRDRERDYPDGGHGYFLQVSVRNESENVLPAYRLAIDMPQEIIVETDLERVALKPDMPVKGRTSGYIRMIALSSSKTNVFGPLFPGETHQIIGETPPALKLKYQMDNSLANKGFLGETVFWHLYGARKPVEGQAVVTDLTSF